jgi:hypothetical protein
MKVCSLLQKIRGKLAAAERMNLGACGDQSAGDEQRSLHVTAGRDANERDCCGPAMQGDPEGF